MYSRAVVTVNVLLMQLRLNDPVVAVVTAVQHVVLSGGLVEEEKEIVAQKQFLLTLALII